MFHQRCSFIMNISVHLLGFLASQIHRYFHPHFTSISNRKSRQHTCCTFLYVCIRCNFYTNVQILAVKKKTKNRARPRAIARQSGNYGQNLMERDRNSGIQKSEEQREEKSVLLQCCCCRCHCSLSKPCSVVYLSISLSYSFF